MKSSISQPRTGQSRALSLSSGYPTTSSSASNRPSNSSYIALPAVLLVGHSVDLLHDLLVVHVAVGCDVRVVIDLGGLRVLDNVLASEEAVVLLDDLYARGISNRSKGVCTEGSYTPVV